MKDYLILKNKVVELTEPESKFWITLQKDRVTFKDMIHVFFGITKNKEKAMNCLTLIQSELNKKLDGEGLIIRKMNRYFQYLDKKGIQKKIKEGKRWKFHKHSEEWN